MDKRTILLVAVVVVLIFLVIWEAYHYFGKRPEYPPPTASRNEEISRWIADLARRTGGDINQLTPQERQQLEILTRGNGERALRAALQQPTTPK